MDLGHFKIFSSVGVVIFFLFWLIKQASLSHHKPKVASDRVHLIVFAVLTVIVVAVCMVTLGVIWRSDTYLGVVISAVLGCVFLIIAERRVDADIDQEVDLPDELR